MCENVIPGFRQLAGPPNAEHREAGRRGRPLRGSGAKDLGTGEDAQEGSAEDPGDEAFPAAEGQVGLGVDIVEIARMRRILARTPRFRTRVFS